MIRYLLAARSMGNRLKFMICPSNFDSSSARGRESLAGQRLHKWLINHRQRLPTPSVLFADFAFTFGCFLAADSRNGAAQHLELRTVGVVHADDHRLGTR